MTKVQETLKWSNLILNVIQFIEVMTSHLQPEKLIKFNPPNLSYLLSKEQKEFFFQKTLLISYTSSETIGFKIVKNFSFETVM